MMKMNRVRVGGFTLIELLVVIAIIMILAGLLLPAVMGVKNSARKAKAKADVKQLDIALKAVLSDFRAWPGAIGGPSTPSRDVDNSTISFLNGTDAANTRKICYMEFDKASTNGVGFVDPWKQLYKYALGDDGTVTPSGASATALPRASAAWSLGPTAGQYVTSW